MKKPKAILTDEIVDDIRRVFQLFAEQSRRVEHETGLTGSQLWVVKMLYDTSSMKVTDLARRMYLHPATTVGLLDRLEAKGLVQRSRSSKDRRVVHVVITELGRTLVEKSPEMAQGVLVKALEPLSDSKLNAISEGLRQVVKILGVSTEQPANDFQAGNTLLNGRVRQQHFKPKPKSVEL